MSKFLGVKMQQQQQFHQTCTTIYIRTYTFGIICVSLPFKYYHNLLHHTQSLEFSFIKIKHKTAETINKQRKFYLKAK